MATREAFLGCLNRYLQNIQEEENSFTGYMSGEERLEEFETELMSNGIKFITRCSSASHDEYKGRKRLFWPKGEEVPYFKTPFMLEKLIYRACAHGEDYHKNKSDVKIEHKIEDAQDDPLERKIKRRNRAPSNRKVGCPAIMKVKKALVFYGYAVNEDKKSKKEEMAQKLRKALSANSAWKSLTCVWYVITISDWSVHNHSIGQASMTCLNIHPGLVDKIHALVQCGVTNVKYVKEQLLEYVQDMFSMQAVPDKLNRAFHPPTSVIYTHIYNGQKKAIEHQQELLELIDKLRSDTPQANVYFRPYVDKISSLLFCYQNGWQQHMMQRYGDNICLLDATHKTIKFTLPLFLVCVKTNVGYLPAAVFMLQSQSNEDDIAEALELLSRWNTKWNPRYFMTENSADAIRAIKNTFPLSIVTLSAYHREESWMRWLRKLENGDDRQQILDTWKEIAKSETIEEFNQNMDKQTVLNIFKQNNEVVDYFTNGWLSVQDLWVQCFMDEHFIENVSLNNGIESQSKLLKHSNLCMQRNKILAIMLKVLIEQYLPVLFNEYCLQNVTYMSASRLDHEDVPLFLYDRPQWFVQHVMERYYKAKSQYTCSSILELGNGFFKIEDVIDHKKFHTISFNDACCSCTDFKKWRLPCEHFCSVFNFSEQWPFDKLPAHYRESVFLTLDEACSTYICQVDMRMEVEGNSVNAEEVGQSTNDKTELVLGGTDNLTNAIETCIPVISVPEPEIQSLMDEMAYDSNSNDSESSSMQLDYISLEQKRSKLQGLCKLIEDASAHCVDEDVLDETTNNLEVAFSTLTSTNNLNSSDAIKEIYLECHNITTPRKRKHSNVEMAELIITPNDASNYQSFSIVYVK